METNTNPEWDANVPEATDPEANAAEAPDTDDAIPENAFLIIEGVRIQPLQEPVINIGRKLENHVVIDDPRISRYHSQLRAIRGHYVLFDLDSTGGTFVNGQRTTQTVLYPGDVISLAGLTLVFGQDIQRSNLVETSLLFSEPRSGAQATATTEISTVDIEAVGSESRKPGRTSDPEANTLDTKEGQGPHPP
jgi:pSer/pThr/pTyr-binding forkhead associated (FHA) protein